MENKINSTPYVDISSLTPKKFYEQYQKIGIPVVITGLLADEPEWNLDYLCKKFADQEFVFRIAGGEKDQHKKRNRKSIGSGVALQSMPFTKFAELLRTQKAHENDINLGKCSLQNTLLADTYSLQMIGERLGFNKPASDMNIYVAPGGHSSRLHYDSLDGTLMQLHGTKKVILFPPSQTYNLYPYPIYIHLWHGLRLRSWFSQVSPERPDFKSFPKFQEALKHKTEVILNQGETLFIPAGWWHEVIALGDEMVCAVNRFWRVYPTSRAIISWNRWRAACGIFCALPHTLSNLTVVIGSSNRKQKLKQISHRL